MTDLDPPRPLCIDVRAIDRLISERAHDAAEKWGLPVLPGRPRVKLSIYDIETLKIDGIAGNPYQPSEAPTVEKLDAWLPKSSLSHEHATVRLFTFNDRWGFSTDYYIDNSGSSYGNWIDSSDPYPTRDDALLAAVLSLATRLKDTKAKPYLDAWLHELTAPAQLSLFD